MASRPLPAIPQDSLSLTLILPPAVASSLVESTALAAQINTYIIQDLLPSDWIWHRDSLDLVLVNNNKSSLRASSSTSTAESSQDEWRLESLMRVGDSIEDEWVAVWLVKRITDKWEGVIGSVYDTDGDFLLIEAAQSLPIWVTPSNSENRVWIFEGGLHLIPLSVSSPISTRPPKDERRLNLSGAGDDEDEAEGRDGGGDGWLSEAKALEEIREGRWRDLGVEREAWERIAGYPATLRDHQHRTTLYLPTDIAKALARQPQLVQKAVETFYTRDPTQLRSAAKMPHFPPTPENTVLTQITLTRTAYAQLKGQEFWPSKAFGREWTEPMGSEGEKAVISGDASAAGGEREWRERGVKVAVGFEILCAESKGRAKEYPSLDASEASSFARLSALRQDPEFLRYVDTLQRAGWFGEGELEGSAKWKEREAEAAKGWIKVRKGSENESTRPSFSTLFQAALSLPGPSSPSDLAPSASDDSEAWLDVNPADLETLMRERSAGMPGFADAAEGKTDEMDVDEENKRGVAELEDLAKKVAGFVDGKGEMEGALFDDETLSDDDDSGIDDEQLERDLLDSDDEDLSDDDEEVVSKMASSMSLEEKEARKAKLVPSLPATEWGLSSQKPQPTATLFSTAQPSSKPSKAAPSSSSTPTFTPTASAAESALSISNPTRDLEELDRQQKLKAIANDQAKALPPVKMRRPLLPRDDFDGVDSDDESDEEDQPVSSTAGKGKWGEKATLTSALGEEGEEDEEEDLPQVVGDVEVDMGEEEEEFLKFARDALGVDEGMWEGILKEREGKGAFVPSPKSNSKPAATTTVPSSSGLKSAQHLPPFSSQPPTPSSSKSASTPSKSSSQGKSVRFTQPAAKPKPEETTPIPIPEDPVVPGPRDARVRKPQEGTPDASLDSFEAVMRKMDEELERRKEEAASAASFGTKRTTPTKRAASPGGEGSPKPTKRTPLSAQNPASSAAASVPANAMEVDIDDDFDIDDPLLAMDAELRAALIAAGDVDSDDDLEGDGLDGDEAMDYNLIKNFLESYKSQGGMAGPVGNLVGRLGKKGGK